MSGGLSSWIRRLTDWLGNTPTPTEVQTTAAPPATDCGGSKVPPSEQYLLDEYDHIAQAHFETISSISAFFKHYLLIMSVPVTLAVAILSAKNTNIARVQPYIPLPTAVVAVAGLLVCIYIVNLRFDVLLYARTINAIRKHFFDRLDGDAVSASYVRVLPQSRYVPAYHEKFYFFPVVATFAIVDGAYFGLATGLWWPAITNWPLWHRLASGLSAGFARLPLPSRLLEITLPPHGMSVSPLVFGLVMGAAFAAAHSWSYSRIARYRESNYLGSRTIGVDIDGVLNDHRRMFCETLKKHTGKSLTPSQITAVPVHTIEGTDITRNDEIAVFNDPNYWVKMPAIDDAVNTLKRIREELGYDVRLFTSRDWPDIRSCSPTERRDIATAWKAEVERVCPGNWRTKLGGRKGKDLITRLTRSWLDTHGLEDMPVTVEKRQRTQAAAGGMDRFEWAAKRGLRIFVEDSAANARKLAYSCDLVLLIEHPYNANVSLPRNVMRVATWREVYAVLESLPEMG